METRRPVVVPPPPYRRMGGAPSGPFQRPVFAVSSARPGSYSKTRIGGRSLRRGLAAFDDPDFALYAPYPTTGPSSHFAMGNDSRPPGGPSVTPRPTSGSERAERWLSAPVANCLGPLSVSGRSIEPWSSNTCWRCPMTSAYRNRGSLSR